MNKRQALEETIDLWEQLRITGDDYKGNVLGPHPKYSANCPCCEYTRRAGLNCYFCPVKWLRADLFCTEGNSSYRKWEKASTVRERKMYAGQAVRKARKALRK